MSENVENYAGQEEGNTACCEEIAPPIEYDYEGEGHRLRRLIKSVAAEVKEYIHISKNTKPLRKDSSIVPSYDPNHSEMIANATLAYRHLEDAAMRIGKCIQAYNGGISILDKMSTEEKEAFNKRPLAAQE